MFHRSSGLTRTGVETLKRIKTMKTRTLTSIFALAMTTTTAVWAQTTPPSPSPTVPTAPSSVMSDAPVPMDPAAEAKFKAADKSGKGYIEGAELDTFKPVMSKVDTDKDGRISRAEYATAVKAGIIK
jgi:hypothetical protein